MLALGLFASIASQPYQHVVKAVRHLAVRHLAVRHLAVRHLAVLAHLQVDQVHLFKSFSLFQ